MSCRKYRSELMEWARGAGPDAELRAHVAGCTDCAWRLEQQLALTATLEQIAAEPIPSPDEMSGRVMAEFDRTASGSKGRVLGWFTAAALAAAASLLVCAPSPKRVPAPIADGPQFVAMPYTVPLSAEESATIVRMQIPVSALLAAGFQMPAADGGATVEADVLVSQDGRARAIRPISISNAN